MQNKCLFQPSRAIFFVSFQRLTLRRKVCAEHIARALSDQAHSFCFHFLIQRWDSILLSHWQNIVHSNEASSFTLPCVASLLTVPTAQYWQCQLLFLSCNVWSYEIPLNRVFWPASAVGQLTSIGWDLHLCSVVLCFITGTFYFVMGIHSRLTFPTGWIAQLPTGSRATNFHCLQIVAWLLLTDHSLKLLSPYNPCSHLFKIHGNPFIFLYGGLGTSSDHSRNREQGQ